MKKISFILWTIICSVTLFLISCQDDLDDPVEPISNDLNIEEARVWFEAEHSPIMVMGTERLELESKSGNGQTSKKPIVLQNLWKHAFKSKNKNVEVVEVALRTQGRFGMASKESMEKFRETGNKNYLTSLSRLVVIKHKKSKKMESYIMTMVGETDYLERKDFQLWSNTYLKKDKDFSGRVFFHSVDNGSFVNAWYFENGKVTAKITEKIKGQGLVASTSCVTNSVYTTYEQCTDWYNMGETVTYNGTTCDTWTEYSGSYTECTSSSGGGGGGGGGSSWSSNLKILATYLGTSISDLTEYLECFSSSYSGTSYLTLYADQPTPNSDDTWSGSASDPNVGHTFISIRQGSNMRVLGFYPNGGVKPKFQPSADGIMVNNSGHHYDVSITIEISSGQMNNVTNAILNFNANTYNLNNNNCTDFGIVVANAAGLNLYAIHGTWPFGGGRNPGNLGQSIRNISLSSVMTRDSNGGNGPSNYGTCN